MLAGLLKSFAQIIHAWAISDDAFDDIFPDIIDIVQLSGRIFGQTTAHLHLICNPKN